MTVHDQIASNRWRTVLLFFLFGLLLVIMIVLVSLIFAIDNKSLNIEGFYSNFYWVGPAIAIFGVIWGIISWTAGSKIIVKLSNAKEIKKRDDTELYRLVENLSIAEGLPTPKLYIMEDDSLNAFATGSTPKKSIIVITSGLRAKLNKEEIEGVLAHELSHIKNRDVRVMLLAIVMVGVLQLLADLAFRHLIWGRKGDSEGKNAGIYILILIAIYILGYLGSILVQMALSRRREYLADASGALMTRNPQGLISALKKISHDSRLEALDGKSSLAYLCIEDPFKGKKSFLQKIGNLFATHPPITKRIAALEKAGF